MELIDKISERRHDEVLMGFRKLALAISDSQKEDPELKELLAENSRAINNFVEVAKEFGKQEKQELKIETNQDKVVGAIADLGVILKGIGDRLSALEKKEDRPLPTKLRAQRDYSGEIDYVIIEYKK